MRTPGEHRERVAVTGLDNGRVRGRATSSRQETLLIFITAKFAVKPEYADRWPELSREFTQATRAEEGCLWFEWSRSLDDPDVYVLVEAFRDDAAGAAHVASDHFGRATSQLPTYLARTPDIVNVPVEGTSWSELGEMAVR
jgi:quinol monooxygenase YgiN